MKKEIFPLLITAEMVSSPAGEQDAKACFTMHAPRGSRFNPSKLEEGSRGKPGKPSDLFHKAGISPS